jgi:hypothetical protein
MSESSWPTAKSLPVLASASRWAAAIRSVSGNRGCGSTSARGKLDNAQRTHRFSMLADLKSLRSISELREHAPLPLVIRYYLLTY